MTSMFNRDLPAVGSHHPGGLGRAGEGRGRRGHAARQSPLCECESVCGPENLQKHRSLVRKLSL